MRGYADNDSMIKAPPNQTDGLEPRGRRARKALAVRQALFDAGLAAFERQPIGLVSVLDITEAADVAKGVFYLQFKSKDDYLLRLWEEVQRRFLDTVRTAALDCRSQAARVEAAVEQFESFAQHSSAATRFWIRMSSYFPDEVGQPGHLSRIRHEYIKQLAAIVTRKTPEELTSCDTRRALVLDSLCWAIVSAEAQTGEILFDTQCLVKAAQAASMISP